MSACGPIWERSEKVKDLRKCVLVGDSRRWPRCSFVRGENRKPAHLMALLKAVFLGNGSTVWPSWPGSSLAVMAWLCAASSTEAMPHWETTAQRCNAAILLVVFYHYKCISLQRHFKTRGPTSTGTVVTTTWRNRHPRWSIYEAILNTMDLMPYSSWSVNSKPTLTHIST